MQHAQPSQRAPRNEALFGAGHGFRRGAECLAGARFDFDKNQRIAIPANEVHLPAVRRAEVAIKHLEAQAAKVPGRNLLPLAAQDMPGIARFFGGATGKDRVAFGEPAKSCGDGLDKAHGRAA